MRSRALSAAAVASSDALSSPSSLSGHRNGEQSLQTASRTRDVESDDDDDDGSSSEGEIAVNNMLPSHQDGMSAYQDMASTSAFKSPESAPPATASMSFLRQRSHADIVTDSDEDDDDNRSSRMLPRSQDATDIRFSSPALARRRYPSTSVGPVSTGNAASSTMDGTAARRTSSRSRRSSISKSHHSQQQAHSRSFPTMFDVKGKGVARAREVEGDSDTHENDEEDLEDGFASVPYDYDRIRQGELRTAPLLPYQHHYSSTSTARRAVSHSQPSRRYTTAFDPFITSSNMPSYDTITTGESPNTSSGRVRKKRSYTIAATGGAARAGTGERGGGGSGSGSGRTSRRASGSSSPDPIRGGLTPLSISSQHNQSTNNSNKRRSNHLPRSASDFISSSSTSPNTSIVGSSVISTRPTYPRNSNSGSTSPLYPRSQSSGNILNTGIGRNDSVASTTTRSRNTTNEPDVREQQILRNKSSGLQMRSKSKSKDSPIRTSFHNTPSPQIPLRENSQTSTRKRAKSSLYPFHDTSRSLLADGMPESSLAGTPGRSVSSQHFKSWSAVDDLEPDPRFAENSSFHKQDDGEVPIPSQNRRNYMDEPRDIVPAVPHDKNMSPNGSNVKPILNSASQPISIAAMVSEESQGQVGSYATINPTQGPSLQELLGQVDLKSALSLVREATGNIGDSSSNNTFSSTGIRASVDAPSTFRSNSPTKSTERSAAASPVTNGSNMTGTPLLSKQNGVLKTKNREENAGGQLEPSASIHIVPATFDNGRSDKKRKRLSMKRIFGHHDTSHNRTSSHDTSIYTDGHSSTPPENGSIIHDTAMSSYNSIGILEEIRNKVDPTMKKYISSVKSELEIRYLPIYTALAMGQDPPNPLAVARYLSNKQEENRRTDYTHTSLSPDSPSSRRFIEDAKLSGQRFHGTGIQGGQQISLADKIRKKGHKRSVWEVYPRDIAAFTMSSKDPNHYDPYDGDGSHRSEVLESLSRGKHLNHRHASSEISLGSLASIREDRPLDAFRQDSRHRHNLSLGHSNRHDGHHNGGGGGGRYTLPLSPTRSRSGQSDVSSYLASDDAIATGHTLTFGGSTNSDIVTAAGGPGWTSEGYIQSSPEYSKFSTSLPNHKSSLSWSNKGFKMLRGDQHFSSSILRHSGRSSQDELTSNSKSLGRMLQHGTESDGGGRQSDERRAAVSRPGYHRSTTSDGDLRTQGSNVTGSSNLRPAISRSTSKTSSLAGFSKILAGRRSTRAFGKDDGYRSNTDTEEYLSSKGAPQGGERPDALNRSENTSRQSNPARADQERNTEQETEGSLIGHVELHVQEIDVDNDEMERAEKFLHDLKASLSKAEALERRAPPKMQTYIQKYFDYDTQRLQKGQLALVQLPPPPMLCRHFKPPPHDEPSPGIPNQANETVTKDRHTHDMHKLLAHIDAPSCTRSSSNSSLPEDEKRTPLLEKVTYELEEATETLEEAIKRSQEILKQQDAAKNKITETVELANSVETSIGGEVFQQLRMLEDHLMRLTYHATDTRGYADAAWAVLSYILRIFFWFSWIGVTILRLIKATIMLPFTVVVTILRWIFL